jgi:uncharacterized protein (DUF58 family)
VSNNDKVGAVIFSDRIEKHLPPRKGRRSVLRMLRELLYCDPEGDGTDVAGALDYLQRVSNKRGVVFLISDFLAEGWERSLKTAARRHEIIGVSVEDPMEGGFPARGLFALSDAEGDGEEVIDMGDASFRSRLKSAREKGRLELRQSFQRLGLGLIEVNGRDGYVRELLRFFKGQGRGAKGR